MTITKVVLVVLALSLAACGSDDFYMARHSLNSLCANNTYKFPVVSTTLSNDKLVIECTKK